MTATLVTGAAGFLGAHLTRRLLDAGDHVVALDNYRTGRPAALAPLRAKNPDTLGIVRHDVTIPYMAEVDRVFHLACPASPRHYQRDPVTTVRTSVVGTDNMLALARALDVPLVFTSTSEVYGNPHVIPQPESYWGNVNPVGPRACYDEGKRAAETLCYEYRAQYDTDTRIARLFNTYGPGLSPGDGRVVSTFIDAALAGRPLVVHGDGLQTRSLCYVDDTVDALLLLGDASAHTPGVAGPINVGSPADRTTMLGLAHLIVELTGSASPIVFVDRPRDDPDHRQPDITRAATVLGWAPTTPLDEGLSRTIDAFA